jgi:hypothetical protein
LPSARGHSRAATGRGRAVGCLPAGSARQGRRRCFRPRRSRRGGVLVDHAAEDIVAANRRRR